MTTQDHFLFQLRPRHDGGGHGKARFSVDLRSLHDGHRGRKGLPAFRGRPIMADAVAKAIFRDLKKSGGGKSVASFLKQSAFALYRFLDCKNVSDCSVPQLDRELLREFASSVEHRKDAQKLYAGVARILEPAFAISGGKHLVVAGRTIPNFPRNPFVKGESGSLAAQHIYSDANIAIMVKAALDDIANVNSRISTAHALAAKGRDPVELNRQQRIRGLRPISPGWQEVWTEENTLWFVRRHGMQPISASEFERRTGVRADCLHHPAPARQPASSAGHTQMQSGLGATLRWFLPSLGDLVGPIVALALTTQWNEGTILDMRRSELVSALDATASRAVTIVSRKGRSGGAKQSATLRDTSGWIPDALRSVIEWTTPLHNFVQSELREIAQKLQEGSCRDNRELQRRREDLLDLADRVWLFMPTKKVGVARVQGHHVIKEAISLFEAYAVGDVHFTFRASRNSYANSIASSEFEAGLLNAVLHHRNRKTTFKYVEKTTAAGRLALNAFRTNTAIQESVRRCGRLQASLISSLTGSSEHASRR